VDARVEGVQERLRLSRRKALDAERRGGRHEHALEAVALDERGPGGRVVGAQVERLGRLAAQLQLPAVAPAAQARYRGARGQEPQ